LNYNKNNYIYNTNNYIFYMNTLNYIFKSFKKWWFFFNSNYSIF
jgi:hypothetical protein